MSLKRSHAQASASSTCSTSSSSPAATTSSPLSLPSTSSLLPPNLITDPSLTLSLQRYLQRRQYSSNCPEKTLSVQEFALKSVLGNEVSGNDAVAFTCVAADAGPVDQQYSRFKVRFQNEGWFLRA
jgi:hypothetical protein